MSNPYPSGYPSVPVSSGLINSPNPYSGSPGPMSNNMNPGMPSMSQGMGQGMQQGHSGMGGLSSGINPGMGPGMSPGMNQGMGSGGNPGMPGGMMAAMGGGIPGGMHSGLQTGMSPGVQSVMPTGLPPGMPPGMSSGMQPGMSSVMQPGMSSVLSSALGGNIAPSHTSRMSPVMSAGMGPGMQHPMQGMPGGIQGAIQGMSPMPMQYSLGPGQSNPSQGATGMVQGAGPPSTPNSNTCDSVAGGGSGGSGSSTRIAPGTGQDGTNAAQAPREINTASLCRIGQETVQDIVSRTQEIFQTLKTIQPPNGTAAGANAANEKKLKVQDQLRRIRILFKQLRLIYEKCNDNSQLQGMEYTHIESLIPLKDEWDGKSEERKNSEAYRQATEEHRELVDAVVSKNKLLKDIIDHMRRLIWEINTMLMMRRS